MTETIDSATLDQWYVIESCEAITCMSPRKTRLLGKGVIAVRQENGDVLINELSDTGDQVRQLPVRECYDYVWTTLGKPDGDVFSMPEFYEEGRRMVVCGIATVRRRQVVSLKIFWICRTSRLSTLMFWEQSQKRK